MKRYHNEFQVPAAYKKTRFRLVLDTGANMSILPLQIVRKCGLEKDIQPMLFSLQHIHGTNQENGFLTVSLRLGCRKKVKVTHGFVVSNIKYFSLLGRDFLCQFSCKLFLTKTNPYMILDMFASSPRPD